MNVTKEHKMSLVNKHGGDLTFMIIKNISVQKESDSYSLNGGTCMKSPGSVPGTQTDRTSEVNRSRSIR